MPHLFTCSRSPDVLSYSSRPMFVRAQLSPTTATALNTAEYCDSSVNVDFQLLLLLEGLGKNWKMDAGFRPLATLIFTLLFLLKMKVSRVSGLWGTWKNKEKI
jgi:hypothetical protein